MTTRTRLLVVIAESSLLASFVFTFLMALSVSLLHLSVPELPPLKTFTYPSVTIFAFWFLKNVIQRKVVK